MQDPMRGGKDQMFEDLVAIVHAGDPEAQEKDARAPPRRRLVPEFMLQDPMRGGKDQMFEDLVAIVHAGDPEAQEKDARAPPRRRLVPEFMLQVARRVSPF
ncbi:hypothetical protein GH714_041020 [Hevea brasiliensis]|uniref:Uncharacterized protein n=1 Tax=Hevea brasiliensis TaxID=3981 RepID=A0A6A6N7R0_HEVBR|nr:hypothetical protein GH714_041020 [Hevea brasiliensis]